jgi:DNA-binding NarL/FixJ family response regulator
LIAVAVGQLGGVIGRGLVEVLEDDRALRLVGSGLDHAALEAAVAEDRAQVVVLDEDSAAAPSVPGRLCAAQADVGLAVLAYRPTRAYALRVGTFGVDVCIASEAPAPEIVRGVRLAAEGGHGFVPASGRPAHSAARALGMLELTHRERQVLKLLSRGQKHAEVAETLNVSLETARTHAKHIYHKLGVISRKELLGIDP